MSIELYPSVAKIKRNGVYENLPGFVPETGAVATQQMIATAESNNTAQYVHNKGEYFRLNDTLYQAIVKINIGDAIVVGTNCEVAVLGNDVTHIANSIADYELGIATSSHNTGDYFMVGEIMYVATDDIQIGDTISTSTNCQLAVIGNELSGLKTTLNENLLDKIASAEPSNWFNPDAISDGIMKVNGTVDESETYVYTDYIPVNTGDLIVCWRPSPWSKIYHYRIAAFDSSKTALSQKGSSSNTIATFTVQEGVAYIIVTLKKSNVEDFNIMIVKDGLEPTRYSEYFEPYEKYTEDFLTPESEEAITSLTDGTILGLIQQNATNISSVSNALTSEITRATTAESLKVNNPLDENNQPVNGTSGQLLRTNGDGSTTWVNVGEPTTEQINSAVESVLEDNPSWRSTVTDGSLTEAKFSSELKLKTIKEYYTPEMYGAVGNGTTDDKIAIEAMLSDVPNNAVCIFYNNYYISNGITVTKPVNILMYGTLKVAPSSEYCIRISGHDVRRNTFRINLLVDSSAQNQWNGTYNTIGLDCYETWENTFDVSAVGFAIGVRLISTNHDCTYNKFFIRNIYNCKTGILLTGDELLTGGATSQNTFIGGRIGAQGTSYQWLSSIDTNDCYFPMKSVLVGSRSNNNNNFLSCSFEGFGVQESPYQNRARVEANLNYCALIGCRYEGITGFSSQDNCVVLSGYGFSSIPNKVTNCTKVGIPNAVGNMRFNDGRPQWWDGSKWVYADGTVVS